VIFLVAAMTCGAAAWIRLAADPFGPAVPWLGLAWTLLFARHSRRASFVAMALLLGLIDGIVAPAAWIAWPAAYLAAGTTAFATRRVFPVRGSTGELAIGALAAIAVRLIALPFPPAGLPAGGDALGPGAVGAALTGIATAALVALSGSWTRLRMSLASVT
jgi:hypothetical protein